MASEIFNNNTLSKENESVKLYALLTIGTSGAVTKTRGKGIASAALSTTGTYVLTLDSKYTRLLNLTGTVRRSTWAALAVQILAETVASTKTITIGIGDYDTTALTEPTSGDLFYIEVTLGNTTD